MASLPMIHRMVDEATKRTPQDKGTTLTIEVTVYDRGVVSINGVPKDTNTVVVAGSTQPRPSLRCSVTSTIGSSGVRHHCSMWTLTVGSGSGYGRCRSRLGMARGEIRNEA